MEKPFIRMLFSPDTGTVSAECGDEITVMTVNVPETGYPVEPVVAMHGYRDEVMRAVQAY